MRSKTTKPVMWMVMSLVLVSLLASLVGCRPTQPRVNDNEDDPKPPRATAVVEDEPTQEEDQGDDDKGSGAIDNRRDAEQAVIRIVAQGDYVYPTEDGYTVSMEGVGSGSGFIIDPEGIAITNNHVVTGADIVKVYFSDNDKAYNAKVLGVSECSDLAVIDIDGDDFPYLEWYDGEIDVDMDVWSAGYPLGDPEYSFHRGIISKADANGENNWASVDSVIEHDATINPGNSGGPLINEDGQVVGVNYKGASTYNMYFAIGKEEVDKILDELKDRQDVNSIGVNGEAFASEDGSFSGIWVYSVDTGSPAYKAGVRGGDIIMELEGSTMGVDNTLADYCDVLRSHNMDDEMTIKILRTSTLEVLEGVLNGDKLAVTGTLEGGDDNGNTSNGNTGTADYIYDDFSVDSGNFEIFSGAEVFDGIFYMGKFPDCADVGSGQAFGCFSTCLTCGIVSNYGMSVNAAYADGVTERTFGMVLRFVDNDGDGFVDNNDYYLDFELSIWDKYFVIWEHNTSGQWNVVAEGGVDEINGGRKWNNLAAVAQGDAIDIYINDIFITSVTDIPYTEGSVGLVVGGRALQIGFDDFYFELR